MTRIVTAILFFSLGFLSFNSSTSVVRVELKNISNEDFKKVYVNICGQKFEFENLKKDESKNLKVEKSYRYCYMRVITSIDTLICQPIDFVGEKLYTSGKLVMPITIITNDQNRSLIIQLK